MKVRGAIAGTPFGARLTALCWGALTLLAPVAALFGSNPTAVVMAIALMGAVIFAKKEL